MPPPSPDFRLVSAEQAALRRVAELVARGAEQTPVLDAIVIEALTLFDVDFTALLRYEPDGAAAIIALYNGPPGLAVGDWAPHLPDGLVLQVFRSGKPSRVDAYLDVPGPEVARMHRLGITAGAAAPILVEGRLWGVLTAMAVSGPVPVGLEHHLADFAGLAATAVAGAQAKDDLRGLADEQAALRRVAELAARGAEPQQVFEAVAVEASVLLHGCTTTLSRVDPDGTLTVVAVGGGQRPLASVSPRSQVTGGTAVPITVEGRRWGMLAVVDGDRPLPRDTELRLSPFAEIAGIALASAKSRDDLRQLADEQAALRRVAELVARGAALDEVFTAVAAEASKLLGELAAGLLRYEPDGGTTNVAESTSPAPDGTVLPAGAEILVPVRVEGRVWGALTTSAHGSPLPAGTQKRLEQFAELAAAAIANAENKAQLTASRARVVATADEARRRLQRDVHDGAQQRLVQTIITLKLARDAVTRDGPTADLIGEALYHAERANAQLRDLAHGILPAALSQGGLGPGLESLIDDIAVPVQLRLHAPRLPIQAETTAYFVVAEALTNVVKHASASRVEVTVELDGGMLGVEVRDDGVGGAHAANGGGLTGLSDRVEAAEGVLTITSAPGSGTTVHASIPITWPAAAE